MTYKNKEQLKQLVECEGKPFTQVAEEFNVSVDTIYRWSKKFGIHSLHTPNTYKDPIEFEELKFFVGKGFSIRDIAKELGGRSYSTIRYWLKKYSLKTSPKREIPKKDLKFCLVCGKQLINNRTTFCSVSCQHERTHELYIEKWLKGKVSGKTGEDGSVSKHIRKYLIRWCNNKCEICGIDKWMGKDITLVLDHINGNPMDNSRGNLRMVCSNCDSQLPTYKSKNKGNGRHSRKKRYIDGKSY